MTAHGSQQIRAVPGRSRMTGSSCHRGWSCTDLSWSSWRSRRSWRVRPRPPSPLPWLRSRSRSPSC